MKRVYTPTRKKTILIVDNDRILVQIYREKFLRQGFQVEVAADGEQAQSILQQGKIDLVILDLCLPGKSGVDVLASIRSKFSPEKLPVLVLANSYLGQRTREAEARGATRCVAKTEARPGAIVSLVAELLGERGGAAVENKVIADAPVTNDLVALFQDEARQALARLRTGYLALARTEAEDLRLAELGEMHQRSHALTGAATALELEKIAQLASGVEALLIELRAKPQKITSSVVSTLGQAIDTMAYLTDGASAAGLQNLLAPRILVVDDEVISREAICLALGKAKLVAVSLGDSLSAEQLLKEEHFDLIFLDVEMPGRSGLELCLGLREMPQNRTTPVVFVTAHSDFGTQAQSVLSGGNDFIVKPFLSVELAVKTLTWLFRKNIQPQGADLPAETPSPAASAGPALRLAKPSELSIH